MMLESEIITNNTKELGGDWMAHEVALACERECAGWTPYKTDYGVECYLAALDAVRTLEGRGLTGFQMGHVHTIVNRLMRHKPLSVITDADFDTKPDTSHPDFTTYECPRYHSLFKHVYSDGRVEYLDVDGVLCINMENEDDTYSNGFIRDRVAARFPVEMPYYPPTNPYIARVADWESELNGQEVCVIHLSSITKPDGVQIKIDEFWYRDEETGLVLADPKTAEILKNHRKQSREELYYSMFLNSIISELGIQREQKLCEKFGAKFNPYHLDIDEWDRWRHYRWECIWDLLVQNNSPRRLPPLLEAKMLTDCKTILSDPNPRIWTMIDALVFCDKNWIYKHPEYVSLLYAVEDAKIYINKCLDKIEEEFEKIIEKISPLYETKQSDEIVKEIQKHFPADKGSTQNLCNLIIRTIAEMNSRKPSSYDQI